MASDNDIFLFRDDLDTVVEALNPENNVNKYFDEAVTQVSQKISLFSTIFSKVYRVSYRRGRDRVNCSRHKLKV